MTKYSKIWAAAVLAVGALWGGESRAEESARPARGSVVAVGGDEDKSGDMKVLKALLAESGKADPRVRVVTTASVEPIERAREYGDAFKALGVTDCAMIHIDSRAEAFDARSAARLAGADVIFFSGGDQLRLTALLGGTPFLSAVRHMNASGVVVGGTSAGGAVLSDLMVYAGRSAHATEKGHVLTTSGFRFIEDVAFDTHFNNRDRLQRLFGIVASNPENLGIGLDEDTGVIFRDGGAVFEVIGNGKVTVVDGTHVRSDIHEVDRGETMSHADFKVYTLSAGDRFNILTREIVPAPAPVPTIVPPPLTRLAP